MEPIKNIFADIPSLISEQELVQEILKSANVRIERIISTGQVSPEGFWYDQEDNEFVILLQGEAILEFENGENAQLQTGDYLLLPAHQKHRIIHTSTAPCCIWLALFWPA